MNEKCSDRYTFQINRIPTGIPDLIFQRIRVPPGGHFFTCTTFRRVPPEVIGDYRGRYSTGGTYSPIFTILR
jgi:hypothetical protein